MEEQEQEETSICEVCGNIHPLDELITVELEDGQYITVCEYCRNNELGYCDNCNRYVRPYYDVEEVTTNNGVENWGPECYEGETYICERCGERLTDSVTYFLDDNAFCNYCYDVEIQERDEENEPNLSYHHTYANNFYKMETEENAIQFFGIELEVDRRSNSNTAIKNCIETIESLAPDGFFDFKSDSSLSYGFEMAGQPATYDFHNSGFWQQVLDTCSDYEFVSHTLGTCGLHIHVNRNFFENDRDAVCKLWEIFNNNKRWLETFSRRSINHLERWAKFKDSDEMENLRAYKKDYCGRYQAINDTNGNTIEFRLYRGTLNYNTFIATIQFTKWLCDYVESHTIEECKALDFSDVEFSDYSELKQYLEERNLSYSAE